MPARIVYGRISDLITQGIEINFARHRLQKIHRWLDEPSASSKLEPCQVAAVACGAEDRPGIDSELVVGDGLIWSDLKNIVSCEDCESETVDTNWIVSRVYSKGWNSDFQERVGA